jgi:hypothetical protein
VKVSQPKKDGLLPVRGFAPLSRTSRIRALAPGRTHPLDGLPEPAGFARIELQLTLSVLLFEPNQRAVPEAAEASAEHARRSR